MRADAGDTASFGLPAGGTVGPNGYADLDPSTIPNPDWAGFSSAVTAGVLTNATFDTATV